MRVLVTWGSARGGTAEIGHILATALRRDGIAVQSLPPDRVSSLEGFDAVIIGGALYANRWHRDARRFVRRHLRALRRVPVWLYSSGPLDDAADHAPIPPTGQVAALMKRIGARGHVTFGGRLAPDATGFPARAMAREHSGDWRNPERIRAWADELAAVLPTAAPGVAEDPRARTLPRLAAYAAGAGAITALARLATNAIGFHASTIALDAVVALIAIAALAYVYFKPGSARDPLPTAAAFTAAAFLADALVLWGRLGTAAGVIALVTTAAVAGLTVCSIGGVLSTLPWTRPPTSQHAA
jgi:menaquinone-dependent protoporphyrinogen oxidase